MKKSINFKIGIWLLVIGIVGMIGMVVQTNINSAASDKRFHADMEQLGTMTTEQIVKMGEKAEKNPVSNSHWSVDIVIPTVIALGFGLMLIVGGVLIAWESMPEQFKNKSKL